MNNLVKEKENLHDKKEWYAQIVDLKTTQVYNLTKDVEYIGRCTSALVVLRDINVSRKHCTFMKQPDGSYVILSNGIGGTYLNGTKLLNDNKLGHCLKNCDVIQISSYFFLFKYTEVSKLKDEPVVLVDSLDNLHKAIEEEKVQFELAQTKEKEKCKKSFRDVRQEWENVVRNLNVLKYDRLSNSGNYSQEKNEEKDALIKELEERLETFKEKEEKWLKDKNEMENLLEIQKKDHEDMINKMVSTQIKLSSQYELCLESKRKLEQEHNEVEKKLKKQLESNQETATDMLECLECSICSEVMVEAILLNCGHSFCKFCITTWKKKRKDCPVCRTKIKHEIRNYFFDSVLAKLERRLSPEDLKARRALIKSRKGGKRQSSTNTAVALPSSNSSNSVHTSNPALLTPIQNVTDHDLFDWAAPSVVSNETIQRGRSRPVTPVPRTRSRATRQTITLRHHHHNLRQIETTVLGILTDLESNTTIQINENDDDSVIVVDNNDRVPSILDVDYVPTIHVNDNTVIDLTTM